MKKVEQHQNKPVRTLLKGNHFCGHLPQKNGWLTESSEEGEDDKKDKSYSVGSLSDSEKGHLPASKWQYLNLKDTNIFYNDKPEPLKEFMQNVKTDITMEFPNFEKKLLKSIGVLPQKICCLLSTLMPSARTLIPSASGFL